MLPTIRGHFSFNPDSLSHAILIAYVFLLRIKNNNLPSD